jgi:hypothetical protein
MSRFITVSVVLFFAAGLCVAQDINGIWKTKMETPNGPANMTFTFKTNGDTLTGTVEGPMGEMPIINGKKKDKTFSFDVSFNDWTINHWCTAMGDSILMKVPGMQGDTMSLLLKREPGAAGQPH